MALSLSHSAEAQRPVKGQYIAFVGTYTGKESKGIYAFRFDSDNGKMQPLGLAAEIRNPTFLAPHPKGRFLYSIGEVGDFQGQKAGSVSAFAVDAKTGKLTLLNTVSTRGAGPCHVSVDDAGRCVLVANYGGGSVAVFRIGEDGKLSEATDFVQHSGKGPNLKRQAGPHAHAFTLAPDNRYAFAPDLGADRVFIYRLDPVNGKITPADPPSVKIIPGAGPRHIAFHPSAKFAYVINELLSTITTFEYDAERGQLQEIQNVNTLPEDFKGESYTAEVAVHRNGRWLLGSNRGHDSLTLFAIDRKTGRLALQQYIPTQGKWPRHFTFDPSGRFILVANQHTNNIVVFRFDPETGRVTPAGVNVEAPAPVCIDFVQAMR